MRVDQLIKEKLNLKKAMEEIDLLQRTNVASQFELANKNVNIKYSYALFIATCARS
jgi:hypothetical protein